LIVSVFATLSDFVTLASVLSSVLIKGAWFSFSALLVFSGTLSFNSIVSSIVSSSFFLPY
jgi:hypothetical protein